MKGWQSQTKPGQGKRDQADDEAYFNEDGSSKPISSIGFARNSNILSMNKYGIPALPGRTVTQDEEEDPLDAYMKEIES